MDDSKIKELKLFVERCRSDPSILHHPSLGFFKAFLESLGAKIPPASKSDTSHGDKVNEDIVESDLELDDADVVEPDNDPPQKMGDPSVEVNDESSETAQMLKSKGVDAISEGKFNEAADHLTEAISVNPHSAILYATRAGIYVKLRKPNAAIRDANAALQINPDSAEGYKTRGMARAMLGLWEEAAHDLGIASTLDYDEEIGSVLKKIEPNVHKIKEHRRKYERLRQERKVKESQRERQQQRAKAEAKTETGRKTENSSKTKASGPDSSAQQKGQVVVVVEKAAELAARLTGSGSNRLAVLYFTATWCGPCRFMAPVYASLASSRPDVLFLKIDIDRAPDVAARWNVSSVPTFFFARNGKEIDKVVGADKASLEAKIKLYA